MARLASKGVRTAYLSVVGIFLTVDIGGLPPTAYRLRQQFSNLSRPITNTCANLASSAAAEQGVAAERLDRGDFVMQKPYNVVPLY